MAGVRRDAVIVANMVEAALAAGLSDDRRRREKVNISGNWITFRARNSERSKHVGGGAKSGYQKGPCPIDEITPSIIAIPTTVWWRAAWSDAGRKSYATAP